MAQAKKDPKNEWSRLKSNLLDFSQQAMDMAQKGEKQFVKFSHQGKLHLNAAALGLKKEKLFYSIGQEYIQAKCPAAPTAKLKALILEFKTVEQERKNLAKQIKSQRKK